MGMLRGGGMSRERNEGDEEFRKGVDWGEWGDMKEGSEGR